MEKAGYNSKGGARRRRLLPMLLLLPPKPSVEPLLLLLFVEFRAFPPRPPPLRGGERPPKPASMPLWPLPPPLLPKPPKGSLPSGGDTAARRLLTAIPKGRPLRENDKVPLPWALPGGASTVGDLGMVCIDEAKEPDDDAAGCGGGGGGVKSKVTPMTSPSLKSSPYAAAFPLLCHTALLAK